MTCCAWAELFAMHHSQPSTKYIAAEVACLLPAPQASEGIDFADGNARGVLLIGIPFPAAQDSKVALKKRYNDSPGGKAAGLLTGDAWYSQQAFRALNQVSRQ
jgi:Fanconi anemia group J protein